MKRFFLAVLASALSSAVTVSFPQTANADQPYNRRPYYHRSDRPDYYERQDRPDYYERQDRPHYYRDDRSRNNRGYYRNDRYREYYPPQYYRGNYSRPRSGVQLIVPVIIR